MRMGWRKIQGIGVSEILFLILYTKNNIYFSRFLEICLRGISAASSLISTHSIVGVSGKGSDKDVSDKGSDKDVSDKDVSDKGLEKGVS